MAFSLTYSQTGEGSALVLLHGNGEDRHYFDAQVPVLAQHFCVFAVDTRGHGQSPRGDAPFTLQQFAQDLAALMDSLALPQADVLGFSDGGNIALLFALQYPQRVRRLIIDGANLYPLGMKFPFWLAIWAAYAKACVKAWFDPGAKRSREMLALMARQPHIPPKALAKLTMPALVISGTRDMIRSRHTRLIARSLGNAQLLWLAGSHFVAMEDPAAFNQAALAFLQAL